MSNKQDKLLKELKYNVNRAKRFYEENKESRFKLFVKYWEGKQGDALSRLFGACDKIIANICFARIETLIPNIISRNMQVTISGDDEDAKILNKLVYNELRNDRSYQEIYLSARDYAIFGEGYAKTYWATQLDEDTLEQDENVVKRISHDKLMIEPVENWNDVKFIAEKHTLTKDEVKAKFGDVADELKYGKPSGIDKEFENEEFAQETVIWEIYCVKNGKWRLYWVDDSFKKILKELDSPIKRGHPYSYMANHKHPNKMLPQGEIEPILSLQNELNKILTQQSLARESGDQKTFYNKGAMSKKQVNDAQNSPVNTYVEVEDKSGIENTPMRYNAQPFIASKENIIDIFQSISGASRLQLGGGAQGNVTARSDMLADARFEGRESQKREDVEEFVRDIVYRLVDNFREYLDIPRKVEVNGNSVEVTKDDLKTDYDPEIYVRINTSGKVVRQEERAVLLQLYSTMIGSGQFVPEEIREVFKRIVQTFDEFEGLDKLIEDLTIVDAETAMMAQGTQMPQIPEPQLEGELPALGNLG